MKEVIKEICEGFPQSMKELNAGTFVADSRAFVNSLLSSPDKFKEIVSYIPKCCTSCNSELTTWKHKEINPILHI